MPKKYVQIDPSDNIIVAITDLQEGTIAEINGTKIILKENESNVEWRKIK